MPAAYMSGQGAEQGQNACGIRRLLDGSCELR